MAIIKASNYAVIPAAILVLWRWPRLSEAQLFFGRTVLLITILQMAALVTMTVFKSENMPLYHLYILLEGPLLLLLYQKRFTNYRMGTFLPWLAGGYASYVLLNAWLTDDFFALPQAARSIEAIFLALLALYYFRVVFQEKKIKHLDRSFWFWLSTGLLLYFTSNLLLFMFTNNFMYREDDLFVAVWSIHGVLNFLLYGFYSIALLCQDRESSSSS